MNTTNAIESLIAACIDDKRMLEHELGAVSVRSSAVLSEIAAERGRFVDDLEVLRDRAAPRRGPGGSPFERLREVGRQLERAATGPHEGDAVRACRRSLRRTEAKYDSALELSWPEGARAILSGHRDRLEQTEGSLMAIQY